MDRKLKILKEKCPQNHKCPAVSVCPVGALSQKDVENVRTFVLKKH